MAHKLWVLFVFSGSGLRVSFDLVVPDRGGCRFEVGAQPGRGRRWGVGPARTSLRHRFSRTFFLIFFTHFFIILTISPEKALTLRLRGARRRP